MDWEPAGLQETPCLENWKRERPTKKSLPTNSTHENLLNVHALQEFL